jgi:cob(I)alamin adenosyltransferase
MNKIFYTGKGDSGKSFIGKNEIDKISYEIKTLGKLDELNSLIGVTRNFKISKRIKNILLDIQNDLFIIQALVANLIIDKKLREKTKDLNFGIDKIEKIEKLINNLSKKLENQTQFIIYGSNLESALFDYLRAVTRETELIVLELNKTLKGSQKLKPEILKYLNRLSSLFYVLARYQAKIKNIKEQHPNYK